MNKHNSYDTSLKLAYSLGIHQKVVPKYIKDQIPSSTLGGWKNLNPEKFIGRELANDICNHLNFAQQSINKTTAFERRILMSYLRLKVMIVELVGKSVLQKLFRDNITKVVNTIDQVEKYLDLKKILKFLYLNPKTFYNWRTQVKFKCDSSAIFLCSKRHPNQSTVREVNDIKKLLNTETLSHWPIASVWGYAIKNRLVMLSLPTWYHYNKILKLRKPLKRVRRKDKYTPITTSAVNELWHADITIFKTNDGIKHFIYTIMDNYSKKILNWKLASKVSASIRLETIKEVIAQLNPPIDKVRLLTDGGPENDNHTIKDFITNCQLDIKHEVALRDIASSNSAIEASNKILKRYLNQQVIKNRNQLHSHLEYFHEDYNSKRPHYSLGVFTPNEVYKGSAPGNPYAIEYPIAAQKR